MANNLYPPDAPQTRRRGRRKKRPAHLPPRAPSGHTPDPGQVVAAQKAVAAAPAAPGFGAARGAANALMFHALKNAPIKTKTTQPEAAALSEVPVEDNEDDGQA